MNGVKTTLLLASLTGLFLFVGQAFGGQTGMFWAFGFAILMNFGAFFLSDKIVLSMYHAQPVEPADAPELYGAVERLAARAGIPVPRLYIIPDPSLNAFATGRSPSHAAVAATEGIVRALSREELDGVLAHEMSHVLNRDTLISTVAATLAGAISMLAHLARFAMIFGGGGDRRDDDGPSPLVGLLTIVLAPIAALLIQMAVSRSREYEADASAARLVGYPNGLINALRKLQASSQRNPMRDANPATAHMFIVNPLSGGAILGLFSTHPPIEKRIERLQQVQV